MPQQWAIRLSVEGDLRFCSHHDMMRAVERLLARSGLPVKYSQGFNPRPAFSFICPRPVGVTTTDDVLVVWLTEQVESQTILDALNCTAPLGLKFLSASLFEGKSPPHPTRMDYVLGLASSDSQVAKQKIEQLLGQSSWQTERVVSAGKGGGTKIIDLHPLVEELKVAENRLYFSLVPAEAIWARPGEVLRICGLDERIHLAVAVRIKVVCDVDTAASNVN